MESMKKKNKGFVAHRENFKVEVKYSPKATKKNLIRFTMKKGKVFEITAGDLVDLIVPHFNMHIMAPAIVDNDIIKMIEVTRVLRGRLEKDMKQGEEIVVPYKHLFPYDFAVAEEALNLCNISGKKIKEVPYVAYEKAKSKVNEAVQKFTELQHKDLLDRMKTAQSVNGQQLEA